MKIVASNVYEWAPGGIFLVQPAYGLIGDIGAGVVEIIGSDCARRIHQVHSFASHGNITGTTDDTGPCLDLEGELTRSTGVFCEDDKTQAA